MHVVATRESLYNVGFTCATQTCRWSGKSINCLPKLYHACLRGSDKLLFDYAAITPAEFKTYARHW